MPSGGADLLFIALEIGLDETKALVGGVQISGTGLGHPRLYLWGRLDGLIACGNEHRTRFEQAQEKRGGKLDGFAHFWQERRGRFSQIDQRPHSSIPQQARVRRERASFGDREPLSQGQGRM